MDKIYLKITSGVAIEGEIAKPGDVVAVPEEVALDFLRRGKAEPAADADIPQPGLEAAPEPEPKPRGKKAQAEEAPAESSAE